MKIITAEIDKIRAVREKISASFGHNPKKLVAFYASLETPIPQPKTQVLRKAAGAKHAAKR